jgi:phosphatidylglycerol:prolipoprotein diacylglycerol transferase
MWPKDIILGPFAVNGYGIMAALGVAFGLMIQGISAPLAGLDVKDTRNLSFWLILSGLFGARLSYVLFHLNAFTGRPLHVLNYWEGGLMFQGGFITALVVAFILLKSHFSMILSMGDALSPALTIGQGLGRIGCFMAGCCHGRLSPPNLWFSVTFPPGSQAPSGWPLYPTQLIEAAGLFLLTGLIFWVLKKNNRPPGLVLGVYLFGSGLLRFFVDGYRGDSRGELLWGWPPTTWMALVIGMAGIILIVVLWKNFIRSAEISRPDKAV